MPWLALLPLGVEWEVRPAEDKEDRSEGVTAGVRVGGRYAPFSSVVQKGYRERG